MNKHELIKEFEEIGIYSLNVFGVKLKGIPTETAITLIEQLGEPQKVKVPQFVADVIEGAREQSVELEDAFEYVWEVATGELREWFRKLENRNNFARAWLDGYEVEEEKRYLVKMKGMSEENTYLTFRFGHTWMLSNFEECEEFRLHHTRKELEEAGFGWVFDCPGIEIEEVE